MRFLGKISYGVFLWQFVTIYGLFAALHLKNVFAGGSYSTFDVAAILVAVTALTIVISAVGYYVIESPAQRLYRGSRARPGANDAPPPAASVSNLRDVDERLAHIEGPGETVTAGALPAGRGPARRELAGRLLPADARSVRSGESGRQAADDDQAQQLRAYVPQHRHDGANDASPEQQAAERSADRGGEQQDQHTTGGAASRRRIGEVSRKAPTARKNPVTAGRTSRPV
jgi:hypothetical protein